MFAWGRKTFRTPFTFRLPQRNHSGIAPRHLSEICKRIHIERVTEATIWKKVSKVMMTYRACSDKANMPRYIWVECKFGVSNQIQCPPSSPLQLIFYQISAYISDPRVKSTAIWLERQGRKSNRKKRERMLNKLKITSSTLVNRDLLLPEMEKAHEIACTGFLAL